MVAHQTEPELFFPDIPLHHNVGHHSMRAPQYLYQMKVNMLCLENQQQHLPIEK